MNGLQIAEGFTQLGRRVAQAIKSELISVDRSTVILFLDIGCWYKATTTVAETCQMELAREWAGMAHLPTDEPYWENLARWHARLTIAQYVYQHRDELPADPWDLAQRFPLEYETVRSWHEGPNRPYVPGRHAERN